MNHYTPNFPEFYEKWGEQGLTQANIKQGKIVRRTTLEALGETHMGFHICYGFAEWEGGKQIKPGFNAFAFKLSDFKEYEIQEITYTTVKIVG